MITQKSDIEKLKEKYDFTVDEFREKQDQLLISIIIPIYNEEKY